MLILFISLNNLQSWINAKEIIKESHALHFVQVPWHMLLALCFYMFLVHYLKIEKVSLKLVKIIVPIFVLSLITQISLLLAYGNKVSIKELSQLNDAFTCYEEIFSFSLAFLIYMYSFFLLYKKGNLFKKIASFDNLKWIYTFFVLAFIGYVLWVVALFFSVKLNFKKEALYFYYPLRFFSTLLIYWLGYQGIVHLRRVKEREQIRKEVLTEIYWQPDNKNNDEQPIEDCYPEPDKCKNEEHFLIIDRYIKEKKLFLKPGLTLSSLSQELKMGTSTLSNAINNYSNKNFSDYLNLLRVEQAKELLKDKEYNKYDIVSIGLESGFNSKSTFYSSFKKYTGCTPLQYRKSIC